MYTAQCPRVLAVDDEQPLLDLYTNYLEPDYHVETANSGVEALASVDSQIDVVLLDRRMPSMSGDEVLSRLREMGYDVRVAMLTAVDPDLDIIDMAFDDYLVKPITPAELRSAIDELIRRSNYDELCQRYFRLASKRAVLETAGYEGTSEYDDICAELDHVSEKLDATTEGIRPAALFKDIHRRKQSNPTPAVGDD